MTMTTSSYSWAAVRAYQAGLAGEVLDASYDNTASVDAQAQKQLLRRNGGRMYPR
ncbi:MAG: hypothetical protein ACLTW9_04335 [Enterocloster sp.]